MELLHVKALRPLRIYDISVSAGEIFEIQQRDAERLIDRGVAEIVYQTKEMAYQTKVVRAEVQPLPARPFRNVPDPDEESPALVAVRNSLREASNVQPEGDPDNLQRRGRGRYRSK